MLKGVTVPLSLADTAALRTIALYELGKALLVIAAGVVSLALLHHDLQGAATHALRHLHLDPASRFSLAILHLALRVQAFDPRWIVVGCLLYATVRIAEAYGLWTGQAWGEWVGALSGAIYLPIEVRELTERVTELRVALLLSNLAIVLFLCWHLWHRKQLSKLVPDTRSSQAEVGVARKDEPSEVPD